MRLLNTQTREFEEFIGRPKEQYTILSHRWGDEEVSFKEYRKTRETIRYRAGYQKIVEFCEISRRRGYRLAWIDTCCIDKRSSAELSEAINSMYEWYECSAECYVWLKDYPGNLDDLHKCAWFSRGWTLQELLAPRCVIFFTARWKVIGHKLFTARQHNNSCSCKEPTVSSSDLALIGPHLVPLLAGASGVPDTYLLGTNVNEASIAARMSWASSRTATRVEDRAYSLMGLFGINIPLLYGEGQGAFRRLQEEILRKCDDSSIFCSISPPYSVLAQDPEGFYDCGGVMRGRIRSSEPYSFTNRGIRMSATAGEGVVTSFQGISNHVYIIDLGCEVLESTSTVLPRVPRERNRPKSSELRYLFLEGARGATANLYHKVSLTSNYPKEAIRDAEWVHVGEKVFFIEI